jgi:hypothetical protein
VGTKIVLMGAGGKIGLRITRNIKNLPEYDASYVEIAPQGIESLKDLGVSVTPEGEALPNAEIVVLALPDRLIGTISQQLVPKLQPGTMLIGLDPAAAYAGVMPIRNDLTYFLTHPCHPPLFNDDVELEQRTDWFGGVHAPQHIVCALHSGPEADYQKGESIAKAMFRPIIESHRITVEQMAILEPALVETLSFSLLIAIGEAYEKVVSEMGVPKEAARAFLTGHLRTQLAQVLGLAEFPYSDGAKIAIQRAQKLIFQPNWKETIFNLDAVRRSVREITDSLAAPMK